MCGLVLAGGLLAATSSQRVPDVVQAKRIEIVNDAGSTVGVFTSDVDGGLLQLSDEHGGLSHVLTVLPSGEGQLMTKNGKGQTLVRLGAGPGGGMIVTEDGKGKTLVELGITTAGGRSD